MASFMSEERFRALSAYASDLVIVVDAGGVIRYAGASHESLLGQRGADLEGRPGRRVHASRGCAARARGAESGGAGRRPTTTARAALASRRWLVAVAGGDGEQQARG